MLHLVFVPEEETNQSMDLLLVDKDISLPIAFVKHPKTFYSKFSETPPWEFSLFWDRGDDTNMFGSRLMEMLSEDMVLLSRARSAHNLYLSPSQ